MLSNYKTGFSNLQNRLLVIVIVLIFLLSKSVINAQESINAAGGNAAGAGGAVAFSIGQVVYSSQTSNTGSIEQGVQHGYQISTIGLNELSEDISLVVFPNPTADLITLQIGNFKSQQLYYQLCSVEGKIIDNSKMSDLPSAAYFLKVRNDENKNIQTFKIIKN